MNTRYLLAVLLVAVISVTSAHDREAFALASARQVALYGPDETSAAILHDQFVSSSNASAANIAFYVSHSEQLEPRLAGGPVTQRNVKRATE